MKPFQNPIKNPALSLLAGCSLLLTACGKKQPIQATATEVDNAVILAEKNHIQPVGTIVTKEFTMTISDGVMKFKVGDQEMEGTMTTTESSKEIIEVLSPTKLRRTLANKDTSSTITINGQTQQPPSPSDDLVGQAVILERSDGTWNAKLEGGSPDDDEAKALSKVAKKFSIDDDFLTYGGTPRKPGDEWDMDPAQLGTLLDSENATGNCTVEFIDFEEFQGIRCALLKLTFNISAKQPAEEVDSESGEPMSMTMQGTATVHRSIADKMDLAVAVEGTTTIGGAPQDEASFLVEGPIRISEKISLKKP